jgi:cell pole-organizing protein PopZ
MSERRENQLIIPSAAWALLLAALCVAPVALGQGQAGAVAPDAGATAHGQPSPAAKPQASNPSSSSGSSSSASSSSTSPQTAAPSPAEPQMQDQSAPAAESLGEAARRARAQKMKPDAAGAPKVYTDDKLSQLSSHGVSVVGDGNSSGGSSSGESSLVSSGANAGVNPGGESGASGGKNDEQYWRGRARAIHDQLAQCDQEISKLQDEIAKYGAVSVDPQSGAMQSIIYVNDRNAKIKSGWFR